MIEKYFHAGNLPLSLYNLHTYRPERLYRKNRIDGGIGLYVVDHWSTANRYHKGSRKFYLLDVECVPENNICNVSLDIDTVLRFFDQNLRGKGDLRERILRLAKDGKIKVEYMDNIIVESNYLSNAIAHKLINFYIQYNVKYRKIFNRFGYGETMIVIYDTTIVRDMKILRPKNMIYELNNN